MMGITNSLKTGGDTFVKARGGCEGSFLEPQVGNPGQGVRIA